MVFEKEYYVIWGAEARGTKSRASEAGRFLRDLAGHGLRPAVAGGTPALLSLRARDPFGWAGVAVAYGVEHEFDAGGDTEFFEDAKEIFLDSVFGEV